MTRGPFKFCSEPGSGQRRRVSRPILVHGLMWTSVFRLFHGGYDGGGYGNGALTDICLINGLIFVQWRRDWYRICVAGWWHLLGLTFFKSISNICNSSCIHIFATMHSVATVLPAKSCRNSVISAMKAFLDCNSSFRQTLSIVSPVSKQFAMCSLRILTITSRHNRLNGTCSTTF